MEPLGAFPDGEWESFGRMFFTEEADFTAQYQFPNEHDEVLCFGTSSTFWPTHEANANMSEVDESCLFHSSDILNSNLYHFSQESSYSSRSSSVSFPTPSLENYYFSDFNHIPMTDNAYESMDFCLVNEKNTCSSVPVFPDNVVEMVVCLNEEGGLEGGHPGAVAIPGKELQLKRKSEMPHLPAGADDKTNTTEMSENPKKKSRVSKDVQKSKKNEQSKKNQKVTQNGNDEEDTNAGLNGQSSSSYSSEDDFNASQELNGGATSDSKGSASLNLNGKTRASRGSATDPQSLYARKRRERINERLRILQNLVPNGTKVDISTMLEEAVNYVKFLQLQIKLLSSDDMWMYSPIAYNGMDIDLIRKSSSPL